MLILFARLCFWVARLVGRIWDHFHPDQGQPPLLPPSETMAADIHPEPPGDDPVSLLARLQKGLSL
jgi:hypothetical protein